MLESTLDPSFVFVFVLFKQIHHSLDSHGWEEGKLKEKKTDDESIQSLNSSSPHSTGTKREEKNKDSLICL